MISYNPLWITLVKAGKQKTDLYEIASSATVAKMSKNEPVSLRVVEQICLAFNCSVEDVIEILPDKHE